ncbi:MAG: 23S rRNA (uracil1939-C5)-methyltransferase [Gammaproteobacteria bacterium]|jgi:23S rRNA (uracil1939-C5)-methyltransferase
MSRRRKKLPVEPVETIIESLSHEGRGVSHIDGKTIFVDGALVGETVTFRYRRSHSRYAEGSLEELIANTSIDRVEPKCKHFSICGGCSLQHMATVKQIQHKESVLLEQLEHIGGVKPAQILPALTGPLWGYRHKARLGVKHVLKKEKVLVGFREKYSSYVADIDSCEVLHPAVGLILNELATLIADLTVHNKIAQIEVAVAENRTALIFRNLADLTSEDVMKLDAFANEHQLVIYLQPGGPTTVVPLSGESEEDLSYHLDEGDITIHFAPSDFTQVNVEINQQMVKQVVTLLDIKAEDNILDLFCGLGNFTLPIARRAAHVMGVEGAQTLVEKARLNARLNNIVNAEFLTADLSEPLTQPNFSFDKYNKILLDPPRSGAQAVIEQMMMKNVSKLVYVSCNPATLARDAGILVNKKGYKLVCAGIMDMFPHTTHVESIAMFER